MGSENADLLLQSFGSIAALAEASAEEISGTPGIGPVIAASVREFFGDPRMDLMARLEERGPEDRRQGGGGPGRGRRDRTPGGKDLRSGRTLPSLSRQRATEMIQDAGGRVVDSVSAKTDYVVAGESPGWKPPGREAVGIAILDEAGLREAVGAEPPSARG